MANSRVVTLFASAVHDTREDIEEVAARLLVRVSDLTAHASGALAGQVDDLGERLSARIEGTVGRLSSRVADRVVEFGEALTGQRREPGR